MMPDKKTIACRLVNYRGKRTQQEVAEANGISISALSMYENGQRIPRDEVKATLAAYYGVSIEDIFFAP